MSLRTTAGVVLLALALAGCAQPAVGDPQAGSAAAPAPEGARGDGAAFCAALTASQERLKASSGRAFDPAATADEWERLAAAAPAEYAPDLQKLADAIRAAARGEQTAESSEQLLGGLDRFKELYSRLCG